mgnify:CR=1 FL=1
MRAVSLSIAAIIVSEAIWKSSLKAKIVLGIIILILALTAWLACPAEEKKE